MKDALCIRLEPLRLSLSETHPTDPKQIPFLKLISYDSSCRSDHRYYLWPDLTPAGNKESNFHSFQSESAVMMIFFEYDEDDVNSNGIHPVDCLLALILCSDES